MTEIRNKFSSADWIFWFEAQINFPDDVTRVVLLVTT